MVLVFTHFRRVPFRLVDKLELTLVPLVMNSIVKVWSFGANCATVVVCCFASVNCKQFGNLADIAE